MNLFDELFGGPLRETQKAMPQKTAASPSVLGRDAQRQYRKSSLTKLLNGIAAIAGGGALAGVMAYVLPLDGSDSMKALFLLPLAMLFGSLKETVGKFGFG